MLKVDVGSWGSAAKTSRFFRGYWISSRLRKRYTANHLIDRASKQRQKASIISIWKWLSARGDFWWTRMSWSLSNRRRSTSFEVGSLQVSFQLFLMVSVAPPSAHPLPIAPVPPPTARLMPPHTRPFLEEILNGVSLRPTPGVQKKRKRDSLLESLQRRRQRVGSEVSSSSSPSEDWDWPVFF